MARFPSRLLAIASLFTATLLACHVNAAPPSGGKPGLIPWPKTIQVESGKLAFPATGRVTFTDASLAPLAAVLADEIFMLTGRRPAVAEGPAGKGDVALALSPDLKDLAHRVEVNANTATASGGTYGGVAMASVTLLQAMTVNDGGAVSFPHMTVDDEPGSVYIGTMLDVARQWHPAESLKPIIQMCRLYKIKYLHLHLTDNQLFTFPSTAFPKLATDQHYTLEELKDLVAFADARGVTIVPEIEMPGHTRMDAAMPELFGAVDPATGQPGPLGVLNIANEEIFPALETLIGEVCDVFPASPFFHMGGDETDFSRFNANPSVQEHKQKVGKETHELFADFINRINAIVKKRGKRTIAWEGFGRDSKVDTDIIVMAWHGSSHLPGDLMDAGHDIINVPWIPSIYNTTRENYEWNIWRLNLTEAGNSTQFDPTPQVLGGQMVLWEKAPHEALPMLRTKAPARQERVYAPHAKTPYEDFAARLAKTDALLDRLLYPVRIEADGLLNKDELNFDKSATVKIVSSMKGTTLRYEVNGGEPTASSPVYDGPIIINASQAIQVYLQSYYGRQVVVSARAFDADGAPVGAATTLTLRNDPPRLRYALYKPAGKGTFSAMPDFAGLKPFETGVIGRAESASKIKRPDVTSLAVQLTAKFEAENDGEYAFSIVAAPAAELRIDGKVVCAIKPDDGRRVEGAVTLTKGMHDLQIGYYTNDGQVQLDVPIERYPERVKKHWEDRGLYEWLQPIAKQ